MILRYFKVAAGFVILCAVRAFEWANLAFAVPILLAIAVGPPSSKPSPARRVTFSANSRSRRKYVKKLVQPMKTTVLAATFAFAALSAPAMATGYALQCEITNTYSGKDHSTWQAIIEFAGNGDAVMSSRSTGYKSYYNLQTTSSSYTLNEVARPGFQPNIITIDRQTGALFTYAEGMGGAQKGLCVPLALPDPKL